MFKYQEQVVQDPTKEQIRQILREANPSEKSKSVYLDFQLIKAVGYDKNKLLNYLLGFINDSNEDMEIRKAAGFFLGFNINAFLESLPKESNNKLSEAFFFRGQKITDFNEEKARNLLKELLNVEDDIISNIVQGINARILSKSESSKEYLRGVLPGRTIAEHTMHFPKIRSFQQYSIITNIPLEFNIPATGGLGQILYDTYINPFVKSLGGSINTNQQNGTITITFPKNLNVNFNKLQQDLTTFTNDFLYHNIGNRTVIDIIQYGAPEYGWDRPMLAPGKSIDDVKRALGSGDVIEFLNCLHPNSPLRRAFSYDEQTKTLTYIPITFEDFKSTVGLSASVQGLVPLSKNTILRLFVLPNFQTLFMTNAEETESLKFLTNTFGADVSGHIAGKGILEGVDIYLYLGGAYSLTTTTKRNIKIADNIVIRTGGQLCSPLDIFKNKNIKWDISGDLSFNLPTKTIEANLQAGVKVPISKGNTKYLNFSGGAQYRDLDGAFAPTDKGKENNLSEFFAPTAAFGLESSKYSIYFNYVGKTDYSPRAFNISLIYNIDFGKIFKKKEISGF